LPDNQPIADTVQKKTKKLQKPDILTLISEHYHWPIFIGVIKITLHGVYNSWKSWKSPGICMVLLEILYKMTIIDHIGFQS